MKKIFLTLFVCAATISPLVATAESWPEGGGLGSGGQSGNSSDNSSSDSSNSGQSK